MLHPYIISGGDVHITVRQGVMAGAKLRYHPSHENYQWVLQEINYRGTYSMVWSFPLGSTSEINFLQITSLWGPVNPWVHSSHNRTVISGYVEKASFTINSFSGENTFPCISANGVWCVEKAGCFQRNLGFMLMNYFSQYTLVLCR